jgi:hypothetical protein
MAYDNESSGVAPWKPEYGARVFKYDALLSYRRPDMVAVRKLAEFLGNTGIALWWDENGDENLADGQLIERIGHAVFHSRYIIVCVSDATPLSEWMDAEFAKGLAAEVRWGYTRVLVARLDAEAKVPQALANCPRYTAGDSDAALAEFVKIGNRFDFIPIEIRDSVWKEFFERPITGSESASPTAQGRNIELLLGLTWKIDGPDCDKFCQSLMSMRCSVDRIDRRDLESVPGLSSMLLRACFRPALQKNHHDNRANAIGTMARLAELGNRDAVTQLLLFLAGEQNAGVISMAFGWMSQHLHELTGDARAQSLRLQMRRQRSLTILSFGLFQKLFSAGCAPVEIWIQTLSRQTSAWR